MWKKLFVKNQASCSTAGSTTPPTSKQNDTSATSSSSASGHGSSSKPKPPPKTSPIRRTNLRGDLGTLLRRTEGPFRERLANIDASQDSDDLIISLRELRQLVHDAWHAPNAGRDFAVQLLEIMGEEGFLHKILDLLDTENETVQAEAAKLVEVSLSSNNRSRIAKNGLIKLVRLADTRTSDVVSEVGIALLEHMFKHSETTCDRIVQLGGLDVVLYACRTSNETIRQHCAKALANCAMFGGRKIQNLMVKQNAHHWLFTLAFCTDVITCYYASLAISLLAVNKEVITQVEQSGSLKLVEHFVASNDPDDFVMMHKPQLPGRSREWLERLIPLLFSKERGPQAFGAFHLAMEATLKLRMDRVPDFYETGLICPLKRVASSVDNEIASNLAIRALKTIGEEVPPKLRLDVYKWSITDVKTWLHLTGFDTYADSFCKENQVDGELLLSIGDKELEKDLGMTNGVMRKRFLRELMHLKEIADYSSCDHDNLATELCKVGGEYVQYTFNLVNAGLSKTLLSSLSSDKLNTILREDCGIENGVHRLNIVERLISADYSTKSRLEREYENLDSPTLESKPLDVFISYRRSNGSHLASLIKVYLHLRGFKVHIDIDKVDKRSEDTLSNPIRLSKTFVLVLSEMALDPCISDPDKSDLMHKDGFVMNSIGTPLLTLRCCLKIFIVDRHNRGSRTSPEFLDDNCEVVQMETTMSLNCNCNVIPVLYNFKWPTIEKLPEDMRKIYCYSGIKWIHDYQDACVDKLERFLRHPVKPRNLLPEPKENVGNAISTVSTTAQTHSTQTSNASPSHDHLNGRNTDRSNERSNDRSTVTDRSNDRTSIERSNGRSIEHLTDRTNGDRPTIDRSTSGLSTDRLNDRSNERLNERLTDRSSTDRLTDRSTDRLTDHSTERLNNDRSTERLNNSSHISNNSHDRLNSHDRTHDRSHDRSHEHLNDRHHDCSLTHDHSTSNHTGAAAYSPSSTSSFS